MMFSKNKKRHSRATWRNLELFAKNVTVIVKSATELKKKVVPVVTKINRLKELKNTTKKTMEEHEKQKHKKSKRKTN